MENLNLESFKNAINSLDSIITRYDKENDIDLRDAVIQRFEYTYSIALKIITRFIKSQSVDTLHELTFNETIRKANQLGLLKSDLIQWTEFRQKRNLTSHTYDEAVANDVLKIIPLFLDESKFILSKLHEIL